MEVADYSAKQQLANVAEQQVQDAAEAANGDQTWGLALQSPECGAEIVSACKR